MRVLFTGHPLVGRVAPWAGGCASLGGALTWAGHEVRGLVTAGQPAGTIRFRSAGWFAEPATPRPTWILPHPALPARGDRPERSSRSSDEQISRYRDAWRQRLDREVDDFNPHVIHAGHLWWDAQLALETGVPYVVSAWSAELTACADRHSRAALGQQAAENASRIFVPHRALGGAVQEDIRHRAGPHRACCRRPSIPADRCQRSQLSRQQLLERFGLPHDRSVRSSWPGPHGRPDSGLDVVINAAARCQAAALEHDRRRTLIVVIASSGEPDPEWTRQAARLGLDRFALVEIRHDADWLHCGRLPIWPSFLTAGRPMVWTCCGRWPPARRQSSPRPAAWIGWPIARPLARLPTAITNCWPTRLLEALAGSWKATQGKAAAEFVRRHHGDATAAGTWPRPIAACSPNVSASCRRIEPVRYLRIVPAKPHLVESDSAVAVPTVLATSQPLTMPSSELLASNFPSAEKATVPNGCS